MVRIVAQDVAILAGARLGLVGVHQELTRAAITGPVLGHERPLERCRKTGAATAAKARALDLVDDPVAAVVDKTLRATPRAARLRAVERPVVQPIEIGE